MIQVWHRPSKFIFPQWTVRSDSITSCYHGSQLVCPIYILYMRRWSFLVVRPWLSSSNPNFSKPRSRTAISDFWNYNIKTYQCPHHASGADLLVNCLEDWNPLAESSTKKFWGWGLRLDNPWRMVFFFVYEWPSGFRGSMTGIFAILESSAWYSRYRPIPQFNSFFFNHRRIISVYRCAVLLLRVLLPWKMPPKKESWISYTVSGRFYSHILLSRL